MKTKFVLTVMFLMFYSFSGYSDNIDYSKYFSVKIKLKSHENSKHLATENSRVKDIVSKHNLATFRQSWTLPVDEKTLLLHPELPLLYWVEGFGDKESVLKDFFATGLFDENYIEEFGLATISCVYPDDERFLNFSGWALNLIQAPVAWTITCGNPNILIGVADTDFELTHDDLRNKYEYVIGPVSAGHQHGTSVASVAGAETNNSIGMASIGYNSRIAAHRILHTINNDGSASASPSNIQSAIFNLHNLGVRIINVSWTGTGLSFSEASSLIQNGTTLVLSGGNTTGSTNHSAIAIIDGVINVSSVNSSNMHGPTGHARNQWIDICAPGFGVVVARNGNDYSSNGIGTSFAAPFVAGTVALIKSVNNNLTPAEIENIIKATASPIADGNQFAGLLGAGLVNAGAAVKLAAKLLRCSAPNIPNTEAVTGTITGTRIARARNNVTVQNATVQNGARLELEVCNGSITINAGFKIEPSGRFIIW